MKVVNDIKEDHNDNDKKLKRIIFQLNIVFLIISNLLPYYSNLPLYFSSRRINIRCLCQS